MAAVSHLVTLATTNNGTSYPSGSFTPANGDLLVAMVHASGSLDAAPTLTDSLGGTWTRARLTTRNAADTLVVFVRDALIGTGVSMTVTFGCSADDATGVVLFVAGVSGMSAAGSSAVQQTGIGDGGAGATPGVTFAGACSTGNPVIGFFGNASNPAGITPPSGFTERADTGHASPVKGGEYATVNSGFTASTITWGSNSANVWSAIGVELAAVAAGTNVTGSGSPSVTLSVSASGAGTLKITGSGAPTVTLSTTGSGTGTLKVTGSGAPTVTLSVTADGDGTVETPPENITGSGAPTVTLSVAGAGTGVLKVTGSGAPSVSLSATGAGTGTLKVTGSGAPTVTLSASAAGSGTVETPPENVTGSGSPAVSLSVTGAGTGVLKVTGSGGATVTLSVTATGEGQVGDEEPEAPTRRGGGFRRILYDPAGAQEEIEEEDEAKPDEVPEIHPLPEPGPLPAPRNTEPTKPLRLPKKQQIQARVEIVDDDDEIDFILNVVLDLD